MQYGTNDNMSRMINEKLNARYNPSNGSQVKKMTKTNTGEKHANSSRGSVAMEHHTMQSKN